MNELELEEWNWVGPAPSGRWSSVRPENRSPMLLMFISYFILCWWSYINIEAVRVPAIAYLFGLIFTAVLYFLKTYADIGEFIDLGDPSKTWMDIALGFFVALPFSLAALIRVFVPTGAITELTPLGFLFVALVASFCEELFFGGCLTPIMCSYVGVVPGLLLNGVVFAIFHYNVYGVQLQTAVWLFIMRVLLSYLILWRRSLTVSIVGHTFVNFSSALMLIGGGTVV
ncbi:MAG: CPBP family intramembrane glutamic endopeptidase [Candidatus Methanospirareceae archaeon]